MDTPIKQGLTWHDLQETLRDCTKEEEAQSLFDQERAGQNRTRWLVRIQGRIRALRKDRENADILGTRKE